MGRLGHEIAGAAGGKSLLGAVPRAGMGEDVAVVDGAGAGAGAGALALRAGVADLQGMQVQGMRVRGIRVRGHDITTVSSLRSQAQLLSGIGV